MTRRAWLNGLTALALVVVVGVTWNRLQHDCGADIATVPADESSSPFLGPGEMAEQPDEHRDTLVRALESAPAPIGAVVGAVGYHYEQWAQLSAYAQGVGVRTRHNPDFTMLDDATLRPRWSVQIDAARSAYDASRERYVVATLRAGTATDLVALDADDGRRVWCATLGGLRVAPEDPFATHVSADEDVTVLAPGDGRTERLTRVAGRDGATVWDRSLDLGAGGFLGDLGDGVLVAGGERQFAPYEATDDDPAFRPNLVAVAAGDGSTRWTRRGPVDSGLHVVGTDPGSGIAVVQEWNTRSRTARLTAIDRDGSQEWYAVPAQGSFYDATVRAGRVLLRAGARWAAYDVTDGRLLWRRVVPDRPQFLPYGFQLDSVPLLDDDHVLIGGTTALHSLDLRTGAMVSARLPTDGVSTTYWPYQVVVSDGLVAVATNTGAVAARREELITPAG